MCVCLLTNPYVSATRDPGDQQCLISHPDQQPLTSSIHLHSSHFSDQQHLVSSPNQLHLIFVYTTLLFSTYSPDQQCLVFISTSSYPASLQKATSNFPSLPAMVCLIISTPTTSFQEQIFKNCLHQTYYIKLSRILGKLDLTGKEW